MKANRFRFRAWHPDREKMFFANHDEVIFCIDNDGIHTEEYGLRDQLINGEHVQDEAYWEYPCVIMQSTGLLDKNGVEIFESDITTTAVNRCRWKYVNTRGPDGSTSLYKQCVWRNFTMIGEYGYGERETRYGDYPVSDGTYDTISRFDEIIGNIYENPELLEESK